MKLLHVSESISSISGGLQNTVCGFAEGLQSFGHQILVVAGKDCGELSDLDGLKAKHLDLKSIHKLKFLKGLGQVIEDFCPDIIIQHGIWNGLSIQVTFYSKKYGIPYVVVPHGMLDPYILNKNKFEKKMALALFQRLNLDLAMFIRALNQNEAAHVAAITKTKTHILPNGLNGFFGCPQTQLKSGFSFLGRIDHKKGVLELLDAWGKFKRSRPLNRDCLKIAGWSSDSEYFGIFKDKLNDLPSVEYVGPIFGSEKIDFLRKSKYFILPSRGEGLPTSVLEAWDCKAVVIMTPDCNFPSACFGKSAIECTVDPVSIFNAICKCDDMSQSDYCAFQEEGSAIVSEYDWSVVCEKFSELICESD